MVPHDPSSLLSAAPASSLRTRSPRPAFVRTSSSTSVAGEATFAAAPPPLPALDKRSALPPSSAQKAPPPRPSFPRRRPRLLVILALAVATFLLFLHFLATPTTSLLYLLRFKLADRVHSERWSSVFLAPFGLRSTPCALRKEPLLFVRGEWEAALVWETTACAADPAALEWSARLGTARAAPAAGMQRSHMLGGGGAGRGAWDWRALAIERVVLLPEAEERGARIVHTARVDGLRGGELYQYELLLGAGAGTRTRAVVRHAFPWLGREVDAKRPTTLHVACVADNQYNLRVFRRVLVRLLKLAGSLPSRYFAPAALPRAFAAQQARSLSPLRRPHLLLHAGDAVQNPHDLAQWQTDLWDPLTRGLGARWAMGQKTPVLLARGNHDWDRSGENAYTGGAFAHAGGRGTYYAVSLHKRMRVLVLDSNLPTVEEQQVQERWLEREVAREEWTRASFKVAVVHTAPWIEWWDREAWTTGGESQWSSYVRTSLLPLLARAECALVLSGHSHAYTRGFLPYPLVHAFSSARNSSAVAPFASAAARERGWERSASVRASGAITERGLLLLTFGGAGGTLDTDRVEDWGFMGVTRSGAHHVGWMALSFAGAGGAEPPSAREVDGAMERVRSGKGNGATRVYDVGLTSFGAFFMLLGVIMLFDGALIALGNILFVSGLPLIIGPRKTFYFFARRNKLRGTFAFVGGIALVFLKYPFFGVLIEMFGFLNLFGDFFPVVLSFMRQLPVVGHFLSAPGVRQVTDRICGVRKQSPV
ncbi:hypothetical protein JCM10450v2_006896 [Rhodotorula kratochvilovae]